MTDAAPRGLFITFEGIDGSGKTTQMRLLAERLRSEGRTVLETIEPGGTDVGEQIRRILLDRANHRLMPTAEMLLYFASRAQNLDERIFPALDRGDIVLCDRYTDSTMAYQGIARGLGAEKVAALHAIACRGRDPDLTFIIDVDLETSRARAAAREREADRIEGQALEFHYNVRQAYIGIAQANPRRVRMLDGAQSIDTLAAQIWREVQRRMLS